MTNIRLLERTDWDFRWAGNPSSHPMPCSRLYVHHTAGNPMHNKSAEDAFEWYNEFAINDANDDKIAIDYTMLVHRTDDGDMTVGVARGEFMPAATKDQNEVSKAICLLGYYHPGSSLSEEPTDGDIEAIAFGIREMIDRNWLVANPYIWGHRDNPEHPGATSCPGDYLYPCLPEIRALVEGGLPEEPEEPKEQEVKDSLYLGTNSGKFIVGDGVIRRVVPQNAVDTLMEKLGHDNLPVQYRSPLKGYAIIKKKADIPEVGGPLLNWMGMLMEEGE